MPWTNTLDNKHITMLPSHPLAGQVLVCEATHEEVRWFNEHGEDTRCWFCNEPGVNYMESLRSKSVRRRQMGNSTSSS